MNPEVPPDDWINIHDPDNDANVDWALLVWGLLTLFSGAVIIGAVWCGCVSHLLGGFQSRENDHRDGRNSDAVLALRRAAAFISLRAVMCLTMAIGATSNECDADP